MDYKKTAKEISDRVEEKNSHSYSKTDMVSLMHSMINDTENDFTIISKKNDKPVATATCPAKELRISLEPTFVSVGLDKAEAKEAAAKVQFSKKTAEALVNLNDACVKTYLDTGRKYSLPMTTTTESKMSFLKVDLPEKVEATKRPVTKDGVTTMELTGKTIKTSKRGTLKAKNVVPPWLKSEM